MAMDLFKLFGVVDIKGDMALRDLKGINQEGRRAEGTMKSLVKQSIATAAGFGIWQAVMDPLRRTISEVFLGLNAQLETANIGFTTMLGSAEAAQDFLKEMATFAARTPFEFPDLQDSAKRMLALGFAADEIFPALKAVGDAAAGLGAGKDGVNRIILALGQMRAKSKVSAQEMMQLTEAGIPAWQILSEAMGMSTQEAMKLSEKGLIPAHEATNALLAGMAERFPNMMDALADTYTGVTSTIKDNVSMMLADMTKQGFNRLKDFLTGVRDTTSEIAELFSEGGMRAVFEAMVPPDIQEKLEPLGKAFSETFTALKDAATGAAPILADIGKTALTVLAPVGVVLLIGARAAAEFAQVVERNWGIIKPILASTLAVFLSYKAINTTLAGVKAAQDVFRGSIVAGSGVLSTASQLAGRYRLETALMAKEMGKAPGPIGKARAAISAFNKTLMFGNPIMLAISAAVALLAGMAYLVIKNWEVAPPFFRGAWGAIKGAFDVGVKGAIVAMRQLQYGTAVVLDKTIGSLLEYAKWSSKILAPVADLIPGIRDIHAGLRGVIDSAQGGLKSFVTSSASSLDSAKADLDAAQGRYTAAGEELKDAASVLGGALWDDIRGLFGKAKDAVSSGADKIMGKAKDAGDAGVQMGQSFEEAGDALKTAMKDASGDAAGAAGKAAKETESAWADAAKAIEDAVGTAAAGIATESEKAKLDIVYSMTEAVSAAGEVLKSGGGAAGRAMLEELRKAAGMAEEAITDKSGKAGDAMLTHLARAANAAATGIKDATGSAARSMYNALSQAALQVQGRMREMAQEIKDQNVRTLNTLFDAVKGALRRQIEAQQNADRERVQSTVEAERKRVQAVLESIDRQLEAQRTALQAELAEMDEAERTREEQAQDARHVAKVEGLKTQLDEAATAQERQRIQEELSDTILGHEEVLRKRRNDVRRTDLQEQIRQAEEAARQTRTRVQDELEAFLHTKEQEQIALDRFYEQRLRTVALNAEAENRIIHGSHEELLELLEEFGEGWEDLGVSFGERMLGGFKPFLDELKGMIAAAMAALGIGRSGLSSGGSVTTTPEQSGLDNTTIGPDGLTGYTRAVRESLIAGGAVPGGVMHEGGIAGQATTPGFLRRLSQMKRSEVPTVLERGELVVSKSATPRVSALIAAATQGIRLPANLLSGIRGGFEGMEPALAGPRTTIHVDVHDNNFQDGTDAGQRIHDALRRFGL